MISSIMIIKAMEPAKNKQGLVNIGLTPNSIEQIVQRFRKPTLPPQVEAKIQQLVQKFDKKYISKAQQIRFQDMFNDIPSLNHVQQPERQEIVQQILCLLPQSAKQVEKQELWQEIRSLLLDFFSITQDCLPVIKLICEENYFSLDWNTVFLQVSIPKKIPDGAPSGDEIEDMLMDMIYILSYLSNKALYSQMTEKNSGGEMVIFRPKNHNEKEIIPGADKVWHDFLKIIPQLLFINHKCKKLVPLLQQLRNVLLSFQKILEENKDFQALLSQLHQRADFLPSSISNPLYDELLENNEDFKALLSALNQEGNSGSSSIFDVLCGSLIKKDFWDVKYILKQIEGLLCLLTICDNKNYHVSREAILSGLSYFMSILFVVASREAVEKLLDWKSEKPFSPLKDYFTATYDKMLKERTTNEKMKKENFYHKQQGFLGCFKLAK